MIIESPYSAPTAEGIARNRRYLDACILDCIRRGETPYASHKMLTDALNDASPAEREQGIQAGFEMREALVGALTVLYLDLGLSDGMARGIAHAVDCGQETEDRLLGGDWSDWRDPR